MSEGLAQAEWVASWIGLARDLSYDVRKRIVTSRQFEVTSIISKGDSDRDVAAVMDAKSLYDNLTREQWSANERRAALETSNI